MSELVKIQTFDPIKNLCCFRSRSVPLFALKTSALVAMWESELVKLREKVWFKKLVLHKSKHEGEVANEGGEVEDKKDKVEGKGVHRETTLSEDTLCLIMDRFTPC
ncbi:hypothetical protein ACJRO7_034787 [Eucalyptus globulus]|uniref:Uncharacterized protein n=1 Tax=Eucalyptus globulus TaxID=34317 RepID=A0ABD3J9S9_EUCGL